MRSLNVAHIVGFCLAVADMFVQAQTTTLLPKPHQTATQLGLRA